MSDASQSPPRRPRPTFALRFLSPWRRLAVPALVFLALRPLAAVHGDPAAGAETRFLALLVAGVAACLGALAPRRPIAELTAAAAITALWCLPHGTARGALVVAVLLAGVSLAAAGRLRHLSGAVGAGFFVPLALAWQLLSRPDLLLPPLLDPRTVVSVGVLPVLAGLALARLAAVHGAATAWIAGAAVAVVAPGWNVAVTAALVSVAAGSYLGRWPGGKSPPRLLAAPAAPAALAAPAAVVAVAAALVAWPLTPVLAAAALVPLVGQAWRRAFVLTTAMLALSAAVFLSAGSAPELAAGAAVAALALLLLPGILFALPDGPRHGPRLLVGASLLAAGAFLVPDPEALAAGLLCLAPAVPAFAAPAQRHLGLAVLAAVALAAGYPWLHADPLLLLPSPLLAAAAAGVLVALAVFVPRLGERLGDAGALTAPRVLWLGLFAAFVAAAPAPPVAILEQGRVLESASPVLLWPETAATERPIRRVVVESSLVHGAHLEVGTPVARIELLDVEGEVTGTLTLHAGTQTADWAAGRPDLASRPGLVSPEPWARRLAPGGRFFAQTYRATLELEEPSPVATLRATRSEDLPAATRIVVRRVELRR